MRWVLIEKKFLLPPSPKFTNTSNNVVRQKKRIEMNSYQRGQTS